MGHGCPAPGPDRALQSRLPLDPAPSLHRLRGGRRRLVRRLPRYYGRVRLLRPVHHRLRPPAFPVRSWDRRPGRARRSPRFPRGGLVHMPGSLTTRSRAASRDDEAARVAFGIRHALGAPDGITIAARWLACAHPCRRFAPVLADRDARLGADVGRYSFIAEDSHLLPPAGLPALARIIHEG